MTRRRQAPGRARPTREGATQRSAQRTKIEQRILSALEKDARLSFSELGAQVGLSKTPAWARVRDLEQRGLISGYHAEIAPAALGLEIHAFVHVTIRSVASDAFEGAVKTHPAVLECYTTAGDADYLLHVLVASASSLDSLLRFELSRMPGVESISTTVALKTIKPRGFVMDCARHADAQATSR
jgi:Lrp/AsnC family leucine-responsive transcriptional regulator